MNSTTTQSQPPAAGEAAHKPCKRRYHRVSKVSWDALWHAFYMRGKRETYDRVSEKQAISISKKLEYS